MSNYTRQDLINIGLDDSQIDAILNTQRADDATNSKKVNNVLPISDSAEKQLKITNINDLQSYANGAVIRLPDFGDGQPFVARVRRPSMLVLAKKGKIPNSLLNSASELFTKGGSGMDTDDDDMLGDMYDICHIICEAALVEPTLADIEAAGIELSDEQMMAIFNYTQSGVKALESFR